MQTLLIILTPQTGRLQILKWFANVLNFQSEQHNLTAATFQKKILRDECFNGDYMSMFAVSAYDTRAYEDHNSNGFTALSSG